MESQDQNNPTTIETPEVPSLAISDLVLVFNLIRITAERGAIKADEMAAVGTVYDKLFKFLQASGAISIRTPEENSPAGQ
jgi:hypothetical protein